MRFLLDTNAVIAMLKGNTGFRDRLLAHLPHEFGISSIVMHELLYGAYKSANMEANLARIEGLRFEILDFDLEDARCAGELRASLAKAGAPIGPLDVLIAGQALARSLTVVTHNRREFDRVSGLSVEDWQ
jgi:tRNA(fMet)-specific endonuclease VapC